LFGVVDREIKSGKKGCLKSRGNYSESNCNAIGSGTGVKNLPGNNAFF
jgi:hypothetical protein